MEDSLRRLALNDEHAEKEALDVSVHSTNTEISEMTEQSILSQITSISQRNKELETVLAGLEQDQRDKLQAMLQSFEQPQVDTRPKPQEPLLQVWAKNLGLAKKEAENTLQQAKQEQQQHQTQQQQQPQTTNGLVKFFQDRVETFSRNMETLSKALQIKPKSSSLPQIQEGEDGEEDSSVSASVQKLSRDDDSTVLMDMLQEDKKQKSIVLQLQESFEKETS